MSSRILSFLTLVGTCWCILLPSAICANESTSATDLPAARSGAISTNADSRNSDKEPQKLANILVHGLTGVHVLTANARSPAHNSGHGRPHSFSPHTPIEESAGNTLSLERGELFLNPLIDLNVKSPLAMVHARKN